MTQRLSSTEAFFLASKRAEIASLQQLMANSELVMLVSQLIHQLQRERGLSNLFLASKGRRFADQRQQQVAESMRLELELRTRLERLDLAHAAQPGSARLFNNIAFALHGLDALPELRQQVEQQHLSPNDSSQALSRLNEALLAVIFEAADISDDPEITRALVAMFNFMQGKEYAGQERARAALGFAAGQFSAEDLERLAGLIEVQRHSLASFSDFAQSTALEHWQQLEQSENTSQFKQLRQVISRIAPDAAVPSDISEVWYEVATRRIDAMHEIERDLSDALLLLCRERVKQAQRELKTQHDRLQLLDSLQDPTGQSATPLLDAQLTHGREPREPGAERLHADWVRSLYGLVKEQAEGLRRMHEELDEARRALSERKQIERAKGLLMQYQGLDEEQAYRRLQQSSMKLNKPLAEVAARLVADIEQLKGQPRSSETKSGTSKRPTPKT